jgi:catechol 2,3-dioxygenase-like lactoylglutathione lyase family enzyme
MALHRLTSITLGVPDPGAAAVFYRAFGLRETAAGAFATADGGEQLRLAAAPRRALLALGLGVDDPDDLARTARSLATLGLAVEHDGTTVRTVEPAARLPVTVAVAPRLVETAGARATSNGPGRTERTNRPADGVLRTGPVRPQKLSHVALASTDAERTIRFLTDGLGFRISDRLELIAFLRCSDDHHNVAVQAGPCAFLHHTAWEVADVDEVGRGGAAMVHEDPQRQLWGLGRHAIGSNFFWYLRDPAGHFAEYVSDLDRITDAAAYAPPAWEGPQAIYAWAPPLPGEFLMPADLPDLME